MTQQRRGKLKSANLDKFLNLYAEDDTETIILGISRFKYLEIGTQLFDHGIGSVICIKGKKVAGYRKISVDKLVVLDSANNLDVWGAEA